jgi:acyl carrier protein
LILGADLLDRVELIPAMEEEFVATIPDEVASMFMVVADVIRFIDADRT